MVPLTATLPIPLSRLTFVAPVTFQLSVELLPVLMLSGLTLNELTTGFSLGVVDAVPPGEYVHPHVNTTNETTTINSSFIFLPYVQV